MSATATASPLVVGRGRSAQPAVGTWSFPRDPGLTVGGASRITLTNVSNTPIRVLTDEGGADLPARSLLTLNLDETQNQTLRFETPSGRAAEGFFVLHDTISDWEVPRVGAEVETPFEGPIGLVLLSHPDSRFVVEWIADGGVRARVEPGEALGLSFTAAEARSMKLQGLGNFTGEGNAEGVFCGLDPEND